MQLMALGLFLGALPLWIIPLPQGLVNSEVLGQGRELQLAPACNQIPAAGPAYHHWGWFPPTTCSGRVYGAHSAWPCGWATVWAWAAWFWAYTCLAPGT